MGRENTSAIISPICLLLCVRVLKTALPNLQINHSETLQHKQVRRHRKQKVVVGGEQGVIGVKIKQMTKVDEQNAIPARLSLPLGGGYFSFSLSISPCQER